MSVSKQAPLIILLAELFLNKRNRFFSVYTLKGEELSKIYFRYDIILI